MLDKEFRLKADANDYSKSFAEGHLETNGFTEWDIKVKVEEQTARTIVADIGARGTGTIITVSACRIVPQFGIIPICYSVPDFNISGFTAATKQDTIHQIAEQIAKYEHNEVNCYRVDAISIGTVIDYLKEEVKKNLK